MSTGARSVRFTLDREFRVVQIDEGTCQDVFDRPARHLIGKCLWDEYPIWRACDCHYRYRLAMEQQQEALFEAEWCVTRRRYQIHLFPSTVGLEVKLREVGKRKNSLSNSACASRVEAATPYGR